MKISISNIPAKMSEAELKQLFVQYGQVAMIKIGKDVKTGARHDHGMVEMPVEEQGRVAVERLNGLELMGGKLVVQVGV